MFFTKHVFSFWGRGGDERENLLAKKKTRKKNTIHCMKQTDMIFDYAIDNEILLDKRLLL